MEFVAQYVEMQFQLEHNNAMTATMLTVMDATQIVPLETTTTVQPQLLTKTQSLLCVLRHVQLVIMLILHYSHVSLATTLAAHVLLPLPVILVLLQATES
jgi:hypothetical protein